MSSPQERLCSRQWRLRNSAWLLWSIVSFGVLTGVGFIHIGIAARKRKFFIAGVAWIVVAVGYLVGISLIDTGTKAQPANTPASNLLGGYLILSWIGGMVHSFLSRREYLQWKAAAQPWFGTAPTSALPASTTDIVSTLRKAATPAAGTPFRVIVDVNTADPAALQRDLGLDSAWAEHIVQVRNRCGGFTSIDDLMIHAKLPPHVYATIQDHLVVNANASPRPETPGGRRLDL